MYAAPVPKSDLEPSVKTFAIPGSQGIINFYLKPRFILWKINFWNRVPDIICDSSVGTEGPSSRLPPVTGSS